MSLGLQTAMSADGQILEGKLLPRAGQLVNPFTNRPIDRARFTVEGHDHMRFLEPPILASLAPQPFYDRPSIDAIVQQIDAILKKRVNEVKHVGSRLKSFGIVVNLDPERGVLSAKMELDRGAGSVLLEADERGLCAVELQQALADKPTSLGRAPIDTGMLNSKSELELYVSTVVDLHLTSAPSSPMAPSIGGATGAMGGAMGGAGAAMGGMLGMLPGMVSFGTGHSPPPSNRPVPGVATGGVPGAVPHHTGVHHNTGVQHAVSAPHTTGVQHPPIAHAPPAHGSSTGLRGIPGAPTPPRTRTESGITFGAFTPPAGVPSIQQQHQQQQQQPQQQRMPPSAPMTSVAGSPVTAKWLAGVVGPDAQLGAGLTVRRELYVEGQRLLFEGRHEDGRIFSVRLSNQSGPIWADRIDFDRAPSLERIASNLLRGAPALTQPETTDSTSGDIVLSDMLPQAGEVWVMGVVIEAEDAREVRYVPVDPDGQPYGAARVLPRAHFNSAFQAHNGGYRILVRVTGRDQNRVTYVPLDSRYTPVGPPKQMPLLGFLAQFSAEGAK